MTPEKTTKQCRGKCGREKPISDFNRRSNAPDGRQDICRSCQSEFMRDYNARKAIERKQQLTAGDIQIDPKPVPLSSAGSGKKKVLARKHPDRFDPSHEKIKIVEPKKVKLPSTNDEIISDLKQETKIMGDIKVKLPNTNQALTEEEKALIMAALDRYIHVIEGIIEKLSK